MRLSRKICFTLLILLSLSSAVAQKKKDWSFSDRTGIKGVQVSLGVNTVQNGDYWTLGVFREYADTNWSENTDWSKRINPRQFPLMLEVVHAPFRFHSNPYLKRVELTLGFYRSNLGQQRYYTEYTPINGDRWRIKHVRYSMTNRQTGLHAGFTMSQPITHSLMVYGGYGFGINLFGKFAVTRAECTEKEFYQSDSVTIHTTVLTDLPEQTLAYSDKMFTQQFIVGAKAYLTCRINIYAEYNYRTLDVLRPGAGNLKNNGHGFVLGVRYKFNPPEPEDPNAPPKQPDAFW